MKEFIESISKFIGITADTAATIVLTLFTIFLASFFTEIITSFKSYLQRRVYRNLLKINLIELNKGLHKQADSYDKFSKQLNIEHLGPYIFTTCSIPAYNLISQIGYENLYKAFFNGVENLISSSNKVTAFNDVWGTIEYLNLFHKKSFEDSEKYGIKNAEINEQRNKCVESVNRITFALIINREDELTTDFSNYLKIIDDIRFELYQSDDAQAPKIVEETFIQPLIKNNILNKDVVRNYRNIIPFDDFNSALSEASLRYKNQVNLAIAYHFYFKQNKEEFDRHFDKISKVQKVLFNPNICARVFNEIKSFFSKKSNQ